MLDQKDLDKQKHRNSSAGAGFKLGVHRRECLSFALPVRTPLPARFAAPGKVFAQGGLYSPQPSGTTALTVRRTAGAAYAEVMTHIESIRRRSSGRKTGCLAPYRPALAFKTCVVSSRSPLSPFYGGPGTI